MIELVIHVLQYKDSESIGLFIRVEANRLVDHKQRRQSDLLCYYLEILRNKSSGKSTAQENQQSAHLGRGDELGYSAVCTGAQLDSQNARRKATEHTWSGQVRI